MTEIGRAKKIGLAAFLMVSSVALGFAEPQNQKSMTAKKAAATATVTTAQTAAAEPTPAEVMKNVVAKVGNGKPIAVTFSASAANEEISGTLKTAGNKFSVETPASSVWFDGKNMWTANHSSKETTVSVPDSQEIASTNPMAYLNSYASGYRLFFSKRKAPEGKWLVLLNPKKEGTGVKAVEVMVDQKTYSPDRIIVRSDDDSVMRINISKISQGLKVSPTTFTYPADRFAGYELVDLR